MKRLFAAAAATVFMAACYYIPSAGSADASVKLARALGANVTGDITLTVSGPGMATITQTYSADSRGTGSPITIPSGLARTFTITARTGSAALSGSATVDLSPGEEREVVLDPVPISVKLELPDTYNSRLVQADDMTGANWRSITGGDIITSAPMEPITTDFDNQGMLYIANYFTDSALGDVVRIASVYDPTSYEVVEPGTPNTCATALAIDRTIDRVYYAQGSSVLSWKPTVNIAAKPLTYDTGMGPIQSLAADGGVVYFIVAYPSPVALCSWNPAQAGTPKSTSIGLMNPSDIMIKGGYVYVADLGPAVAPAPKILRFTTNLDYVDSFSGPEHDPLIMPMRFIKTLDNQIVVQDENFDGIFDRFLSFTSMTGTDWRSWYPDGDPIRGFNPVN